MAYDPVRQGQLYLRRAGRLVRGRGSLPDIDYARQRFEGEAHERFFDSGTFQLSRLAANIEAFTGATIQGRTVLDYGCGIGRLALPLAQSCEHVYGLDVMPDALREAERNATDRNIANVEWLAAERLEELSGRYDMVVSFYVFQHIPSREGERILATLIAGLRPGGVGALHFTIRPGKPLEGFIRRGSRSRALALLPRPDFTHLYMLSNSYSLNRLGRVLADAGIPTWQVKWHTRFKARGNRRPYEAVTLFFRKEDVSSNGHASAEDEPLGAA